MRRLLTGSSGYIGTRLIPELIECGGALRGVDRVRGNLQKLDSFVHGDLCDAQVAREAVAGVDQILHLAAAKGDWGISEEEYYRDNLEATRVLVEAGKKAGVKDWVFYSTVSVMGPSHEPLTEAADFAAINPYGASKAEAEQLFHDLAEDDPEARVLIVRPSVVYGKDNPPSTNIYRLIDAIMNKRFVMVGPGEALKSTSHIENLVPATMFLLDRLDYGVHTFIYVDEPVLSTDALVGQIYSLLGMRRPSWRIPLGLARPIAYVSDVAASVSGIDFPITAARIEKFNRSTNFDATAIRELGFKQPVSNEEALCRTVEWHVHHATDPVHGESQHRQAEVMQR